MSSSSNCSDINLLSLYVYLTYTEGSKSMLVSNLQTVHQHHTARSSKLLCLFCQLVLKLCYVMPYSVLWVGKGSHRPVICYSVLQLTLRHCLPCYQGEGFTALLWLINKKQKRSWWSERDQGNALQFDCEVTGVAKEKHVVCVMLLPGNS